jgi:hypothetical protein
MKPDLRARALKAHHRLHQQKITGEELAFRMKCGPEAASGLVRIGALIERAEASRLSRQQRDVFKVICRVTARNVMMFGNDDAKISEVDLAAGKRRTGWCGKSLLGLTIAGLVVSTTPAVSASPMPAGRSPGPPASSSQPGRCRHEPHA